MAVVDQRFLVRFQDVNANIINTNDSYYILLLLSLTIGEKKALIYYFKVRRNVCARKVGWHSRHFPLNSFLPSFIFTYLYIPFFHFPVSFMIFHGEMMKKKQTYNKSRNICVCHIHKHKFKTILYLKASLSSLSLNYLLLYFFQ